MFLLRNQSILSFPCYNFLKLANFLTKSPVDNKNLTINTFYNALQIGESLLAPLVVREVAKQMADPTNPASPIDILVGLGYDESAPPFHFKVAMKDANTPRSIRALIEQLAAARRDRVAPLIMVPYLSPERIEDLEKAQVSGVDLCGNGIIIVPQRVLVLRSGLPNLYPISRPLNNPYKGRSAMVARMLLEQGTWPTLGALEQAVTDQGDALSKPQVSKAIHALREDLLVTKNGRIIQLQEPQKLLEKLAEFWRKPRSESHLALRLPADINWPEVLSNAPLSWAVTGESSVPRYSMFAQAQPLKIAVTDLELAVSQLQGKIEPVTKFADVELVETQEPGYYFGNRVDEKKIRWANRVQAWLELQTGDSHQQEIAHAIRQQIVHEVGVG